MKSSDEGFEKLSSRNVSDFRKRRKRKTKQKTRNGMLDAGDRKPAAGRPNCLDKEKLARLLEAYYSHPYSFRELADMFGVSRMTVWRAVQDAPFVAVAGVRL